MVSDVRLKRNKDTQEFFTPASIVEEMLDDVPAEFFKDLIPFREVGCGNGNIIIQIVNKFKKYHKMEDILKSIQLADIMEDNCIDTIKRICGNVNVEVVSVPDDKKSDGLIAMFKINNELIEWIVQADATKFMWWKNEKFGNGLFEIE